MVTRYSLSYVLGKFLNKHTTCGANLERVDTWNSLSLFLVWLFMKHSRTEMVTMTSKILFPLRQQLEMAVVDGARALAVNTSRCKRDAFKLENIS